MFTLFFVLWLQKFALNAIFNNMRAKIKKLNSVEQTGAAMARLVKRYNQDVSRFDGLTLPAFFRVVADIPYKRDPKNVETIHRPKYILNGTALCCDCDDKAVTMGSWLYRQGVPFCFVASSAQPGKNPRLHHTWILADINGKKRAIDPTYPRNKLFEPPTITKLIPISQELLNPGKVNQ